MNWPLLNVILLGLAFAMIFAGFQTAMMVQPSVLEFVRNETGGEFTGDGYLSSAIIYIVFAAANWLAPSIVALLGLRVSLFLAALVYTAFVASFLIPTTWLLYTLSALLGIAAAVLWTAQGAYLTNNSNEQTMSRNSGLFWALFQTSLFSGSLFVLLLFHGQPTMPADLRKILFIGLSSVCLAGTIFIIFLRKANRPDDWAVNASGARGDGSRAPSRAAPNASPDLSARGLTPASGEGLQSTITPVNEYQYGSGAGGTQSSGVGISVGFSGNRASQSQSVDTLNDIARPNPPGPIDSFVSAVKLFVTRDMALLCFVFAYSGLVVTFYSSVYPTSIGHVSDFGDSAKAYIGLTGVFIGVGEVIGGSLFGILGRVMNRFGRDPIVLFGFLCHLAVFMLAFLQLPATSPLSTDHVDWEIIHPYISPNIYLCMLGAFLLGLGESSFITQVMSVLGFLYTWDSAPAFAIFKFVQSLFAAIAFFYSGVLLLHWQLLIMTCTGTVGVICFFIVEWTAVRARRGFDPLF